MRTAKKQTLPIRSTRDIARQDAEMIFKNYQRGEEGRLQIRTFTHRDYLANLNAGRYYASLGSSPMLTEQWKLLARQSYMTAFLERLLTLIDEADHGQ